MTSIQFLINHTEIIQSQWRQQIDGFSILDNSRKEPLSDEEINLEDNKIISLVFDYVGDELNEFELEDLSLLLRV